MEATSTGDVAREENEPIILCVAHDVPVSVARADGRTEWAAKSLPISLAHVKTYAEATNLQ